jgi:AAA domain/Bifunctional DNA primase/polymerase, N-terminal
LISQFVNFCWRPELLLPADKIITPIILRAMTMNINVAPSEPPALEMNPPGHAMHTNRQLAIRLAKAGLHVLPAIVTFNVETRRWDKRPLMSGWREKATTDLAQIESWWKFCPEAIPGIELSFAGLIVIDADRHGGPDGVALLDALAKPHGGFPRGPVTLTAGGGKHLYFLEFHDARIGCSSGSPPAGVDVRGDGGWIVAPGAIRPDGSAWKPESDMPSLESAYVNGEIPVLPDWLAELIRRRPRSTEPPAPASQEHRKHDDTGVDRGRLFAEKALTECAAELAETKKPGRNDRLNAVAYRMGRMIERGWIELRPVVDALWRACEQNGLASDDGSDSVQKTLESGISDGREHPHPELEDRAFEPDQEAGAGNEDATFPGVWDGEVEFEPPDYLVRDLIRASALTLLAGESQAGKSLLALHLAVCVAIGEPFFGKETKRGGTLYVAAEGYETLAERIQALRLGFARPIMASRQEAGRPTMDVMNLPICILKTCPNLLRPENEAELIKTIRSKSQESERRFGVPIDLVIIDTLTSAVAISDWNSAGSTMEAMKMLQRLVAQGLTVVALVHHGKEPNRGPAGSFVLTAAPDSIIAAFRDVQSDGTVSDRRLSLVKSRSAPTGVISRFDLAALPVFKHPDGYDVVSVHIVPIATEGGSALPPRKRKKDSRGLSAFKSGFEVAEKAYGEARLLHGDGVEQVVVPYDRVKDAFHRRYAKGKEKPDSLRTAFTRALKEARQENWVQEGRWDDSDWLWRDPDPF